MDNKFLFNVPKLKPKGYEIVSTKAFTPKIQKFNLKNYFNNSFNRNIHSRTNKLTEDNNRLTEVLFWI